MAYGRRRATTRRTTARKTTTRKPAARKTKTITFYGR